MAKKKETKKVELKEVSRVEINGNIIITYEDGSVKISIADGSCLKLISTNSS